MRSWRTEPGSPVPAAVQHAVSVAYLKGYSTAFEVAAGILVFAFLLVAAVVRPPAPHPQAVEQPGSSEAAPAAL